MSSLAAGAASAASAAGVSPLWYATRATGVVALLLLTGTVVAGIAGTARAELPGLPRVVLAGVHRNLSLLAMGLVVIHVLTTVLDPFAGISLTAAVIPFSSAYRTAWLGLGAVALDLLLAVLLSSLVRDRLSYRSWRAVHWLAYASGRSRCGTVSAPGPTPGCRCCSPSTCCAWPPWRPRPGGCPWRPRGPGAPRGSPR